MRSVLLMLLAIGVIGCSGSLGSPEAGVLLGDAGSPAAASGVLGPGAGAGPVGAMPSAAAGLGAGGAGSVVLPPGATTNGTGQVVDENGNVISRPYTTPPADSTPIPARAWLLTHDQYAASVANFLGTAPDVSAFAPLVNAGQFANFSNAGFVRVDLAGDYADAAASAVAALSDVQLAALVPSGMVDAASFDAFLAASIRRAFRRPAAPTDVARYRALFDTAAAAGDVALGYRAVLETLFTSPYFLYRMEIGPAGQEALPTFQLTDHELASFLSYSLLDAPPTTALSSAADAGQLSAPATLQTAVQSLLADPRAQVQFTSFLSEWLEVASFDAVEKFEATFPGFAQVQDAMQLELDAFLSQNGSLSSGSLASLLTASVPAVDPGLTAFYASDPSAPPGPANRVGLLALGAVLAHHAKPQLTSPTLRGLFVRHRMFCQKIELPPDLDPPPLSDTEERARPTTTRELYELHAADPLCASCHKLVDPIGFNLEAYDGAGRIRTAENGEPLQTTASLVNTDVDREIDTPQQLAAALAQSTWVRECLAIQAYRFYYGGEESSRGAGPITAAVAASGAEGRAGELVAALLSGVAGMQRSRE